MKVGRGIGPPAAEWCCDWGERGREGGGGGREGGGRREEDKRERKEAMVIIATNTSYTHTHVTSDSKHYHMTGHSTGFV